MDDDVEDEVEVEDVIDEDVIFEELDEEGEEDAEVEPEGEAEPDVIETNADNRRILQVVNRDDRKTSEIIQLTELVEAIGIRTTEIERGSPVFTDYDGLSDPIEIARKEFYDRKSPLILQRQVGIDKNGVIYVEEWPVREMTYP
jgi:DNA-directed RNA polymerase I, II, and III subunit RPABC2